nr:PhoX family phosphatase [Nakamurella flava]
MTAAPSDHSSVDPTAGGRRLLPMLGHTRGKRSPVTCHLKCADACTQPVPNETDNIYFRDVVSAALTRRTMLKGAGVGALTLVLPALGALPAAAAADPAVPDAATAAGDAGPTAATARSTAGASIDFTAIAPVPADVDALTVPPGWTWSPIIRWGDPLFDPAETFDVNNQTAQRQARQFGYNNDYTDLLMLPGKDGREALLVCNHEYTNPGIMFSETSDPAVLNRQRAVEMAAQGMAVVHLRREKAGQPWRPVVGSGYNRRITASTPFSVDGAAAGTASLKTKDDPAGRTVLGTFGNCSGGTTPWGTVLSGEENFNGYFHAAGTSPAEKRYGLADKESTYGWENIDPRFDARAEGYVNEPNRFGWIVELDPFSPKEAPVKHTAMGRLKHEGANVIVGSCGQVAAYMGDDERFDYLYKFVSSKKVKPGQGKAARAHNKTLLSEGSLYVAKFSGNSPAAEIDGSGTLPTDGKFDGTGQWLPLVVNGVSKVAGFTAEQALVNTRLAADAVGATKMDRCEDVQPSLKSGKVYVVCTNNSRRGTSGNEGATEVNPRNENRDGHIVEITEDRNDVRATTFRWSLLLVCGDPKTNPHTYFAGFPADQVSPISCPDNIAFDSRGDLWIATDGAPSSIGYSDGLFHVPLTGRNRGYVRQFLAVPAEAETCGPVVRDRDGMVYVAVQHPGEDGTWAAQNSYFPDYVADGQSAPAGSWRGPRPSIVQVYRTS